MKEEALIKLAEDLGRNAAEGVNNLSPERRLIFAERCRLGDTFLGALFFAEDAIVKENVPNAQTHSYSYIGGFEPYDPKGR